MIEGGLFNCVKNTLNYQLSKQLNRLGTKVDRTKWHMSAMEVNAYYNPTFNEMAFPAGECNSHYFINPPPVQQFDLAYFRVE